MRKRNLAEDVDLKCELKKDNSGVPYAELACSCNKIMPRVVYLRAGIDPRFFVGSCGKCDKRYVVRIGH